MFKTEFYSGQKVRCINSDESNLLILGQIYQVDKVDPEGRMVNLIGVGTRNSLYSFDRFTPSGHIENKAQKETEGKPAFDILMSIRGLQNVAKVFEYGSRKYSQYNWRNASETDEPYKLKLFGAALRHIYQRMTGERLDKESGLPHLAHAVSDLLMIIDLEVQ